MTDRPISLEKAVDAFGGFSGLARALGLSLSTVHAWARRSDAKGNAKVPIWRQREIVRLAERRKLDVYVDPPKKRVRKRGA